MKKLASIMLVSVFLSTYANASDLDQVLNKAVARDARGWAMNRYDYGSMNDTQIIGENKRNGTILVKGYYTYNGGRGGWVQVEIDDDGVQCLRYWDFPNTCRPPN